MSAEIDSEPGGVGSSDHPSMSAQINESQLSNSFKEPNAESETSETINAHSQADAD
jgi:hypothetical protein